MSESTMSVQEVAEYLRVHEATIFRLIKSGKLKARKVGGYWFIRRSLVEDMSK